MSQKTPLKSSINPNVMITQQPETQTIIPNVPDEMKTLLQDQFKAVQLSDKRGMRWNKRYSK